MDGETLHFVQTACNHFAEKLSVSRVICHINSAARCFKYNRLSVADGGPGSNDNSQHPLARAIDFWIEGVKVRDLYDYLDSKFGDSVSLGLYKTFVHIDTRTNGGARWVG
jgi:uncharacterized protein YcbK (DUF882 family)